MFEPEEPPDRSHRYPMAIPILRTKLFAPTAGRGIVRRERLFSLLDRALEGRLGLVSAPAGFGKTTLVARWLADRGHRAAWLSLEAADSEPTRFWSYIVAAFATIHEEGLEESRAIAAASDPALDAVVTTLLNELSDIEGEGTTVLVLDDLHVIDSAEVDTLLKGFLEYLPPRVRVVVTTRSDPSLPLSRYRARGEMIELRQADLRFSAEEMGAYLNDALGFELDAEVIRTLEQRTEGWVASLQLAALSLERLGPGEHSRFVEVFAGDDRFVMDYLVDEVLAAQPEQAQRFLLATSVLDRLSAALCAALFEAVSPGASPPELDALDRAGLFLIPLDHRREWYRYHHLFADLLRMRCRVELDEQALLVAASSWFEGEALLEEAIEYAFRAGDAERAAVVLEDHFPVLIGRGEFRTIRHNVDRLPAARVHASTALCLAMAYVENISTNLEAADGWIARGDALLATKDPTEERLNQHRAHLGLLRAFRKEAEQQVDEARAGFETARAAFAALGEPYLECVAEQGLAGALLAEERLRDCERVGRAAWRKGIETGNLLVSSTAINRVVIGMIAQGRLRDAEDACREHLETVKGRAGDGQLLVVGYARVGLAGVLIRRDRLDEAEAELDEVERRSRQANSHSLTARSLMERLRLDLARGRLEHARRVSDELAGLFGGDKVLILVQRLFEVMRVRLDLAEGRISAASEWAATVDLDGSFPTQTRIALALVLRAQGKTSEAAAALAEVAESALEIEADGWALEALVERAMALRELRDTPGAAAAVARALPLAEADGFVDPFLAHGDGMLDLLSAARAQNAIVGLEDPTFVPRLLAAVQERSAGEAPGLLSERELEVLRLLDAGLSNQAAGERLFVSVGTIKRHTHNIYQKLGAARRTEALLKAREVGIL